MKRRRQLLTSITAAIALTMCSYSFAQSILDQQLGPTAPETKKEAPAAADPKTEIKRDARPIAPQLVDPNSAKLIDDMDLVKKLTNGGPDGANSDPNSPDAAMKSMIDHMDQSRSRLADKDTGAVTQETQRRITMDLDVMIEYARQQSQNSQGKSQSKGEQQGEKRTQSQGQKQGPGKNEGGNQAATNEQQRGGGAVTPESNGQDMRQKGPSEWGGMPGRDRDLVSNGVNEQYLPAYKEMIDRYYQALAEIGKSKDH